MKVLICAMAYPPDVLGGGEISTRLLAEGLSACGIDVSVLTFTDQCSVHDDFNGIRVHRIRCPNNYWAFRSRQQPASRKIRWHMTQAFRRRLPISIREAVYAADPHIVHTSTIEDFGAGFWRWAKGAGFVTAHTLRSNCLLHRSANMYDSRRDRSLPPDLLALPKRVASQFVDGVIGISQDILQRHLDNRFFSNARSTVVGNPFQGEAIESRVRGVGDIRLGVLGRLEPDKGILQLIDQLRSCATDPAWRLQVAGDGDPEYVRHLKARSAGLPIEFVGWTESRSFLGSLDLLVIPSRCHEAFGRGVVEAFSVGVPVLCLRRGGLPELIDQEQTGWVLSELSQAGLMHAIRHCRSLDRSQMIRKVRHYTVDQVAKRYRDFYARLVEST